MRMFLRASARKMRRRTPMNRKRLPPPSSSSRMMLTTKSDLRVVFVLLAAQMTGAVFGEYHATETFDMRVSGLNVTSSRVCWTHPLLAPPNKYELLVFNEAKLSRVFSVRFNRNARRQCHLLTDLSPSSSYVVAIRTLTPTKGLPVIFAEVNFTTPSEVCSSNPCLEGSTCVPSSLGLEYTCRCAGRAEDCTGSTCPKCDRRGHVTPAEIRCDCSEPTNYCAEECQPQNDAPEVDCQHGGTAVTEAGRRRCACAKRYFGDRCEHVRSCVGFLRCQNEGVCVIGEQGEERCECRRGFTGDQCDAVDRCVSGPCRNGGYCRNMAADGDYHCFCYDGFYGRNCTRYDPCSSSPCQNNGICRNVTDSDYVCRCRPGFHGDSCELYSPCADNPCLYNGMCNSIDGRFFCDCEQGRFGRRCEYVDLCRHLRPCGAHSVACHNMSNTSYKCICEPGWSGENCTFHNPCYNSPCLNDGVCLPLRFTVDDFRCECSEGFWGNLCEMVNPCFGSPCANGGTCLNISTNAYVCRCPSWYSGEHCEFASSCARSKCANEAHCVNISSTEYSCVCPPRYFGQLCQFFNICSENPCKPGRCHLESSAGDRYSCTCPTGYSGSNCQHYNPCSSNPCQNGGLCVGQADGAFDCKCPNGTFHGPLCDSADACASSPCQRGGSCVNVPPMDFRCICPPSVFGRVCESRDACVTRPCRNGGTCVTLRQMDPGYVCQCTDGYYGSNCESVDPCRLDPCLHGGTCVRGEEGDEGRGDGGEEGNGDGFICHCDIEFQGRQCEDEIPCNTHGKKCYYNGVCDRQPNGTVFCRCPTGYFGFRCQNFDPCSRRNTCINGGTCQVIDSGPLYQCICQSGFFGDHCELHRPCNVYACRNNGTCVHTIQMDICYCRPGFTGRTCEVDLNECDSLPCLNGGSCVDLPGRFTCECPEGYAGDACQLEDVCPRNEMLSPKGVFIWPATTRDSQASLECPRNPGSFAVRSCRQNSGAGRRSRWDAADLSKCSMSVQSGRGARDALGPYRSQNLTDEVIVSDVVSLLDVVLQFAFEDSQVALYMLEIVDRMLSVPEAIIHASNATDRILRVLEKFVENVKLARSNMTFVGSNMQIVVRFTSWIDHESGTVFAPQRSPDVRLFLPAEIFLKDISSDRVQFVYLRNSKLFRSTYSLQSVHDVISANVGSDKMVGLKTCVRYVMPNRQISKHNRCVFWDSNENIWSAEGIETLSYRGRRTVCCSDRLTYFGITSDPEVAAVSFVKEDFEAMVATNSGLGLAITCLGVVLLTYVLCRPFNGQEFGQLVIHLTSSMLATNICLLLGYNRFKVDNSNTCAVIAILTHFFTLSTQLWLAIVAYHILRESSNDYTYQENVFLCRRVAFAWGLPLFPVAISVTVDLDEYRQNPESCLLTGENHYVYCSTYLLPMFVTKLGGFILWAAICRSFCPAVLSCNGKSRLTVNQVLGSLMVTLLADLSWAVYFVSTLRAFSEESAYLRYSFCVMQAATGLAVVFAYLVLRADALVSCRQLTCMQKMRSAEKESGTVTTAAADVVTSSEDAPGRTIPTNAATGCASGTESAMQRIKEEESAFRAHSDVVFSSSISRSIDPVRGGSGVRPTPRQTTSAGSHYRTTKYGAVVTDRRLAGQPLNHASTSLPSRSAAKSQKNSRSAVSSLGTSSDEVLVHTSV